MNILSSKPAVGVAWRKDQNAASFDAVVKSIEAAGGTPVVLDMVVSDIFDYENGILIGDKYENGCLTAEAAEAVKNGSWRDSTAEKVLNGLSAIVFPGGEDISPTLYRRPQMPEACGGICAERDISDYLLMSYCLEKDIPLLAVCRGIQVLAVVSGADMIQDIGDYIDSLGAVYNFDHRDEPKTPGTARDFVFHDVNITDRNSRLYNIVKTDIIRGAPSWHHQAVRSVEGTPLMVTAVHDTSGTEIIEAVERTDKSFAVGIQFHPEIGVVRGFKDLSLTYFSAIVDQAR